MRRLPLLLLVVGCSDYDINPDPKDRQGADDTAVDCPPGEPGCGDEDTSRPDTDDTEPTWECDVTLARAGTVAIQEECVGTTTTVADPWNVREEWHYAGLSSNRSVHDGIAAPVSGNLDDDNGDGVVDEHDIPEIVAVPRPARASRPPRSSCSTA